MNGARLVGTAVAAPFILAAIGWGAWLAGQGVYCWILKAVTPKPAFELPPARLPVGVAMSEVETEAIGTGKRGMAQRKDRALAVRTMAALIRYRISRVWDSLLIALLAFKERLIRFGWDGDE